MRKIAFACDHAGVRLKQSLIEHLLAQGYEIVDLGADGSKSVDYPDFGLALGHYIADGRAEKGVAVCGSGIGISIAANRIQGARCALVHDNLSARLSREHNDANIIAFGERLMGVETAKDCLDAFLATDFAGGRHQNRVDKLDKCD